MPSHAQVFVLCGVLAELCIIAVTFNVSPHPVRVLRNPSTLGQSYFGYSLVYRDGSLLVGAPRHQADTGEIFQCDVDLQQCQPFAALMAAHSYANMWLGGSMAGGPDASDEFVVCGPGFPKRFVDFTLMHGICYALRMSGGVALLSKIHPMNSRRKQFGRDVKFVYALGETGFSLGAAANGKDFVIGAPGVNDWTGAVVFFNASTATSQIYPYRGQYFSYFGYAVSSGYLGSSSANKQPTLLYVVTAPRVGDAAGEAIIMDTSRVRAVLNGTQYGEYFGYAALVIDVNGDGLDDICIGAPQYASPYAQLQYDNGAVYVFLNKGHENFERYLIPSPFEDASRFGTTLSSLGDINLDGYQDLVVGAPFANGNGAVAIYLGSASGLSATPSQILSSQNAAQTSAMFGHGLSRGFDVDGNGYNDLAVGAPEAESVYVYKSYPVVKVIVSMQAKTQKLERKLGEPIIVETCHRIETNATKIGPTLNIALTYRIDPQYKRAQFPTNPPSDLYRAVVASGRERACFNLTATTVLMKMANRPLRISMQYELEQTPKETEKEFCENCAVLDPRVDHTLSETIPFLTDCGNECQVELAVRVLSAPENITLGEDKFLTIRYEVENSGQMSFDAVLNVIAWTAMPFSKYPATCNVVTANEKMHQLSCELARSREFQGNDTVEFIFDASSQLDEEKLSMHVTIGSDSGVERNKMDNEVLHAVQVLRNSYLTLLGASTTTYIQLSKTLKELPMEYRMKLLNAGPSDLIKSRLYLRYPVGYKIKPDGDLLPLVNVSSMHLYSYCASKNARYLDLKVLEVKDANHNISSPSPGANNQLILNCNNTKQVQCVQAVIELDLASGSEIELKLNYALSSAIAAQITKKFDYLTLEWDYELVSNVPVKGQLTMSANLEGTTIVNIKKEKTPLWVYIISILIGLLTLVPVVWGLRKANFFKRQTPEEMAAKVHKRESITKMQSEAVAIE